jgi:hypothetical protein
MRSMSEPVRFAAKEPHWPTFAPTVTGRRNSASFDHERGAT